MKFHITLLAGLIALSSCGEGGGESVFLYFINAYNGVESVSIIGPTGPLVQSAGFGDRMGVDQSGASAVCPPGKKQCIPIEYDRNLGGDFTTIVDGAPSSYEFTYPMFALYPQETATMIFAGRAGDGETVETHMVRHVQSVSETCLLTFINALSLDTNETVGGQELDIIPEFNLTERTGYIDERSVPFPTQCGTINDVGNPKHIALTRDLGPAIKDSPWFFYTENCGEKRPGTLCPTWVNPNGRKYGSVLRGSTVEATRSSIEYYECVQGALTFEVPPVMAGQEEAECPPDGMLTWAQVIVDDLAVAECKNGTVKTVESLPPDETRITFSSQDAADICKTKFRIRTPGLDAVFGPVKGKKTKGSHQKGDLIEIDLNIGAGNEYFIALMGRPVNPLIWRWESGTNIANLNDFPYVNDKDGAIGKY